MPDGVLLTTPGSAAAAAPRIVTDEPVLIFGGCYSNLHATRALLDAAAALRIPPERMICTGDVIAYGAHPRETLALIRDAGIATVMGNCEESLAAEAGDCGCGFAPGSACDRLSAAWFAHASRSVGAEDRRWMAGLPRRIDLVLAGRRLAVVHGAPGRINQFVFESAPAAFLAREIAASGAEGVIGGHCGLPFTRRVGPLLWHNAGAVGLPGNDGTPRGWFSLLTPRDAGIEVRHRALAYDHAAAARAMRAAGLPAGYADAVETGIWPSFDVLPPAEQAATGAALAPRPRVWTAAKPDVEPDADPDAEPDAEPGAEPYAEPDAEPGAEPGAAPGAERDVDPYAEPDAEPDTALAWRAARRPDRPAQAVFRGLETLWFNTGTLCNIACTGCYVESSPRNDRLVYLARADFDRFLDEARASHPELREIGFTGGEPFMNRDLPGMLAAALDSGCRVLVLTNAMRPMQRRRAELAALRARHGDRLALRVSLDHFTPEGHEAIRGAGSFAPAMAGLAWLARQGFAVTVAARLPAREQEAALRAGFGALFAAHRLPVDAADPVRLVLFPELSDPAPLPRIGATAWRALHGAGRRVMCETSRMVVHRKGEAAPRVVACTLLPDVPAYDLGATLGAANQAVTLSHPHCARFCVFGGSSCAPDGGQAAGTPADNPA